MGNGSLTLGDILPLTKIQRGYSFSMLNSTLHPNLEIPFFVSSTKQNFDTNIYADDSQKLFSFNGLDGEVDILTYPNSLLSAYNMAEII